MQALVRSQKTPVAVPTTAVPRSPEPARKELAQRATPNTDNFFVARQPDTDEDRTIFVTKAEVAALVHQEKEKMSLAATCLSQRPPYPTSIATKPYPVGYMVSNFQKFNGRRGNTIEHVSRFIDAMGPFAHNPELRLREFSKSLTDRAYTWYLNLKPGSIQD